MYKYTYIHVAGDKRITKRHEACLLTIAGGTGERVAATVAAIRSPPCCNQANAAGRSTTPTTPTPTRKGCRCGSGWRLRLAACLPACPARPLAQYLPAIFNGAARLV